MTPHNRIANARAELAAAHGLVERVRALVDAVPGDPS